MSRGALRFGILVQAVDSPGPFVELVRRVEQLGFNDFWVADSSLHARCVYSYLALAAVNTQYIRLGTGITNPRTRHPAVTANSIATLHEMSEGRAVLGIGAGDRPVLELGLRPASVRVVKETVAIIRSLLAGETVDYTGAEHTISGANLVQGKVSGLPIYLAGSGARMLKLAGRIGDGVLVQAGSDPRCLAAAIDEVAAGAVTAGRPLAEIDKSVMLYGSVNADRERARAAARPFAAWMAQTVPAYCDLVGIPSVDVEAVQAAYRGGELMKAADAAAVVTDRMIDAFTLAGTPSECAYRVTEVIAAGADTITFFPMGEDRLRVIEQFAAAVMV